MFGVNTFGDCEVRKSSREVFLRGTVQAVEPRTFDLLEYLIDHRDRVVSKDELLNEVWENIHVTDAVITQSIMKARRAIGDCGKPALIKTAHRVGYRFIGSVREAGRPSDVFDASAPSELSVVAWLPTQDGSGQPELGWVTLGLMTLACGILKKRGIECVPTKRLLQIFDPDGSSQSYDAQVRDAREQLPSAAIVSSKLSRTDGSCKLEWHLNFGDIDVHESCCDGTPAALVLDAANKIVELLLRRSPQETSDVPAPESRFYQDAAARAVLAQEMESFAKAQALMAVCIHADEATLEMHGEYLHVLALRGDLQTPSRVQELVRRARAAGALQYEGWAYACLTSFHLFDTRFAAAQECAGKALNILRAAKSPLLLARSLVMCAQSDTRSGEYARATQKLNEAAQLASDLAHTGLDAPIRQQRAVIAFQQGYLPAAGALFSEALTLSQAAGTQAQIAWNNTYCGMVEVCAGDFAVARPHLEAGAAAAERCGMPLAQIFANLHLGLHCLRLGDVDGANVCIERLSNRALAATPLGMASLQRLRGGRYSAAGEFEQAACCAMQSMHGLAGFGAWWTDACWVAAMQAALAAGDTDAARRVLSFLRSGSNFERSNVKLAVSFVLAGMLNYHEGDAKGALEMFQRAWGFGVQTQLGIVIRFGIQQLETACGKSASPDHLAAAGDWCARTALGAATTSHTESFGAAPRGDRGLALASRLLPLPC